MDKSVYLHGISAYDDLYNPRYTNRLLEDILKSEALLSFNKQISKYGKNRYRERDGRIGFNGVDYISLCDYEKRYERFPDRRHYNSFHAYILYSLAIIFPKDKLSVITPELICIDDELDFFIEMARCGLSKTKQYSDMADEVQVKDIIPLSLMSGVTIPLDKLDRIFYTSSMYLDIALKEIDKLATLLLKYGYDIPIYDIKSTESLLDITNVKRLVKEYHKKWRL